MRPAALVRLALAFTVVMVVQACAPAAARSAGRERDLISRAEIDELHGAGVRDAYELISRLRPHWLQIRNERSLRLETVILVYQNNARLGHTDALRNYPLDAITSIRYLDGPQASQLPGAGSAHLEGAILISTRR